MMNIDVENNHLYDKNRKCPGDSFAKLENIDEKNSLLNLVTTDSQRNDVGDDNDHDYYYLPHYSRSCFMGNDDKEL